MIIRVGACGVCRGVCRSDWHLWQEDWTWAGLKLPLPRVLGHEFGGVVEGVGSAVRSLKRRDRVTVPFHLACGGCNYCHTSRSNIRQTLGFYGAQQSGGSGSACWCPKRTSTPCRCPTTSTCSAPRRSVAGS